MSARVQLSAAEGTIAAWLQHTVRTMYALVTCSLALNR